MNHWARMLADLPALGQRTIARAQRISLPRAADATTRLSRLRLSLCRAATVRATYFLLPADAQAALQQLRHLRGGIRPEDLAAHYGPVRVWPQLAADLAPRSVAEQLVLLGWLLLRPATSHHPAHFILPPELRRALPLPLPQGQRAVAPPDTPLAVRAASVLLLACAPLMRPVGLCEASSPGVARQA